MRNLGPFCTKDHKLMYMYHSPSPLPTLPPSQDQTLMIQTRKVQYQCMSKLSASELASRAHQFLANGDKRRSSGTASKPSRGAGPGVKGQMYSAYIIVSCWLTSPMRGRGYSTHSVCLSVCLSVTTLAGATHTLRAQLRYQKKALDTRINITVAIELKVLSSKVMTVCSSPQKL